MRRWSRSLVVFLAVSAGVAGLAGCGGSSSSGSGKAAFCSDNLKLDQATSNASSASDVIKVFKNNQSTIDDFVKNAPSAIKAKAQTLAGAADQAIKTGDASSFGTQAVADAGKAVDSFCGVSSSST